MWIILPSLFFVVYFQIGASQNLLFPSLPIGVPESANKACQEHSDLFVQSLNNNTLWAHEMWDATAKSSSGVLRGNVFQMGHFHQCLSSKAPFSTQYCSATLIANVQRPNLTRDELSLDFHPQTTVLERLYYYNDRSQQARNAIKMGWCVPASCSPSDLELALNQYFKKMDHNYFQDDNVTYQAQFQPEFCQTDNENENYTAADIGFCLFTSVLVFLVLVSSIYDHNLSNAEEKPREKPVKRSIGFKMVMAFSAKKNFVDLAKRDESNPALMILYGMRTLCILMIIVGHRFGTFVSSALYNFNYIETQYRSKFGCLLFHGDLFVDSFFILSGLLVVYSLLVQFDKKYVNPGFIIFLRYIRLTPVYAFVIFYYATIFNYTGNGPLWKVIAGGDSQDCKINWWTNLLYISNYVNADHMCMTHSWYLPCDFHYFIIGLGVCLLIKKEKKLGIFALLLLTIISMAIPFIITIIYERPALLQFYPDFLTGPKTHTDFQLTYSKSHTRATPYFIGMFAGYVYYKLKDSNIHITRIKSMMITIASIILMVITIFTSGFFYDPYHKYNAFESASYAALHRPGWALGSIGLLYVASYGHGKFIYSILTWSPFIPLSKLVYGAYLIHMQFALRSAAKFINPREFDYFDIISLGISDIVIAFLAALGLYIIVEAPFRIIFRELLIPSRSNGVEKSAASQENVTINNNQDSRL